MRNIWKILAVAQIVGLIIGIGWVIHRFGYYKGRESEYNAHKPYIETLQYSIDLRDSIIDVQYEMLRQQRREMIQRLIDEKK